MKYPIKYEIKVNYPEFLSIRETIISGTKDIEAENLAEAKEIMKSKIKKLIGNPKLKISIK